MTTKRTLVLVKPCAVRSGWADAIEQMYVDSGLRVIESYELRLTEEQAGEFYAEHRGKRFFVGLELGMSSGKIRALIIAGEDAIARVRTLNGVTDPTKAEAGTIREKFRGPGGVFNTVHSSDSPENAEREIALIRKWWFALNE